MATADQVADYIIRAKHARGESVTNLELQKLVYYAQAWFLALYDRALLDEPFEAWVHGPVQPDLYQRFKALGWRPISDIPQEPTFGQALIPQHLDEVLRVYGKFTAHQLEMLTHDEEPWRAARGNLPPDASSSSTISQESMKQYYKRLSAGS